MATLTAHYNDSPEDGDFIVIYETETQGCSPYYTLRFGGGLSVFLSPERINQLREAIASATCCAPPEPQEEVEVIREVQGYAEATD